MTVLKSFPETGFFQNKGKESFCPSRDGEMEDGEFERHIIYVSMLLQRGVAAEKTTN